VCDALRFFLDFTGRWDERLALARDAESRAAAAGDFFNAGWKAYQIGWTHYLRGQSADVFACADRAEAYWREAKAGARERSSAIHLRGHGHGLVKDHTAAIAAYSESVNIRRDLDREGKDLAISLNMLANAEKDSGDLNSAERDYREGLRIARAVDYVEGVATYTGNLAALALDRKDWPGAEALARESLPLSEKVGRQELIALDCHRLAKALVRQGKQMEALPHSKRAVEIYQKLGSPQLANAQQTLAECEGAESESD
jgi:tetratricopeptide (TPR) repeat protein